MIRYGKINDAEQIANIKIENYKKTYSNIFSETFLNDMNLEEEKEKYIRGLKNRKVLVYYDDDKILGYIYYGKRKNHKEVLSNYDGEIYAIYVDINLKNKGIGTQLIKTALKDLIKEYKKIILWCMSDNYESIEFYKKRNFKEKDRVKENIGGKQLYENAFTFDFEESNNYTLTRYVSYKEKDNVIAIYSNFDLLFLKNETAKWFKTIVNKDNNIKLPISFFQYLIDKEVIEFD